MLWLWLLLSALFPSIFTICGKSKKSNSKLGNEKKPQRPPIPKAIPPKSKEPTVPEKSVTGVVPDEPKKEEEKEEKKKESKEESKQMKPAAEGGDVLPANDNDTINDVESNWGAGGGGEDDKKSKEKK